MSNFNWTDSAVTRLTELWKDGFSAGHIEADLNGPSRNAVIGKAHRLGLASRIERRPARAKPPKPQRKSPFKPPSDHQVTRPRIGADSRMTLAFDVPRDAMTDLPADESPDAVLWLDRNGAKCKWPLNDVAPIDAHLVCGSKCRGEEPYCARHSSLATNPSRPRVLELSEAERARRAGQGRKNQQAFKERLAAS